MQYCILSYSLANICCKQCTHTWSRQSLDNLMNFIFLWVAVRSLGDDITLHHLLLFAFGVSDTVHVRSFSKFPKPMNTCYLRLRLTHLHNYIGFPEELKWNHGLGIMTKPGKTGLLAGVVALSTTDWCITSSPNSQTL